MAENEIEAFDRSIDTWTRFWDALNVLLLLDAMCFNVAEKRASFYARRARKGE
jgi:hypothetical protein